MKRVFLLLVAGTLIVGATWYAFRIMETPGTTAIGTLVPRETIVLLHVPDLNRTRDQWHRSDLYRLYREPEVQDFLRIPLTRLPKTSGETLADTEQLDPKDAFFALTSISNGNIKFLAGFRFRGREEDAEKIIGKWRADLIEKYPSAKRETLDYQRHKIQTIAIHPFTLASAYHGNWFFVAADLADLKALLDRADQHSKERHASIDGDESYRAAIAHMPSDYAGLFYVQPKLFTEQISSFRAALGLPAGPDERTPLEQVTAICGSAWFDAGKIHDAIFIRMPKLEQGPPVARSSLNLATKDTVFYLAMLLNVGQKINAFAQMPGIGVRIQRLFQKFAETGIAPEDWKAAFGPELGLLVDWPQTTHWPSLLLTLPVVDAAKAGKIVEAAMRVDEDSVWRQTEEESVRYFSMQSPASLFAITPTIALSEQLLVAGLSGDSVQHAMKRSHESSSELGSTQAYKSAVRLLPAPTNFFTYLDTALFYGRLDTTVRPIILMAAPFMPALNQSVQFEKIPAPEIITKHLSPIVSSQRYDHDGYVAESVGPVTLNQAGIGLAILALSLNNYANLPAEFLGRTKSLATPSPSQTP